MNPGARGGEGLTAFMDRAFATALRTYHVPGAVFVLVRNGKVVLARGYGYAGVAHRWPVIPGRTMFRLCSVSKVATATAVMQLVERGKLRLDSDVNSYLTTFQLPRTYRRPVTVADLLTHTAGLDERHIGRATLDPAGLEPLARYLKDRVPPRVSPPGQVYAYSDTGYALAGYLVETVSGMPFARYVERNIFRPLGMKHSSFRQPLPAGLARDRATGYDVSGSGTGRPAPLEYYTMAPASAMMATGTDVARFMIALLEGGAFGGHRILKPQTVRLMQRRHFSSYPPGYPTPAVAYGLGISNWNGRRMLDHSGALRGFTSLMTLLPDSRLGFFIAGNTAHSSYMFDLRRRLLSHLYPGPKAPSPLPIARDGDLARFAGSYWSNEYSRVTIEKLRQMVNQVQVTPAGPNGLTARFWDGRSARLIRVGPAVFVEGHGVTLSYWAFLQDTHGNITRMVPGGYEVYDRIQWYETTRVQFAFIVALVSLMLTGSIVWLVLPLWRRLRRGALPAHSRGAGVAGWLLGLSSTLNLVFLISLTALMLNAVSGQAEHYSWIEYGVPPPVVALFVVPLVTTGVAVLLPLFVVLVWIKRFWSPLPRLHYTLATLAALAFIPFLRYWNLLGFHF